ncbi:MAG: hypothetical protein IKN91_09505 [Paludibacteraceae bacterium]|nr:hypothetical protein [Paludibacteraceae bacterium]
MKRLFAFVFTLCLTLSISAADYLTFSNYDIKQLGKTDTVAISYDLSEVNSNLTEKEKTKLHKFILKTFKKKCKNSFVLVENQQAPYSVVVKLTFLESYADKDNAIVSGTIVFKDASGKEITTITLNRFGGGDKRGHFKQQRQVAKEIIDYLSIFL